MENLNNQDNIQTWSAYSRTMIEIMGDEGDPARRYILNPAIFALLGDVTGLSILDAGCGTGYLCRLLAKRGARVTGIEPASALFAYAVEREQVELLGIDYIQQDLSLFTSNRDMFDIVVANMIFMNIPEYQSAMKNCVCAMKLGGQFIFSLLHPCFDEVDSHDFPKGYRAKGYIRVEEYLHEFVVRRSVGYYIHRPLSAYLNLVIDAGCILHRVIEPALTDEGVAVLGKHNRNLRVPRFIVVSASK